MIAVPPKTSTERTFFAALEAADVQLECVVEASPKSRNYWVRGSAYRRVSGARGTTTETLENR